MNNICANPLVGIRHAFDCLHFPVILIISLFIDRFTRTSIEPHTFVYVFYSFTVDCSRVNINRYLPLPKFHFVSTFDVVQRFYQARSMRKFVEVNQQVTYLQLCLIVKNLETLIARVSL